MFFCILVADVALHDFQVFSNVNVIIGVREVPLQRTKIVGPKKCHCPTFWRRLSFELFLENIRNFPQRQREV